eukprot:364686-Chlamydomonas_euryale.AAC.13
MEYVGRDVGRHWLPYLECNPGPAPPTAWTMWHMRLCGCVLGGMKGGDTGRGHRGKSTRYRRRSGEEVKPRRRAGGRGGSEREAGMTGWLHPHHTCAVDTPASSGTAAP